MSDKKPKTENYKFFSHTECEFFPCHEGVDKENFNCLFCYCPFYLLGDECGGSFKMTENGIKDCSECTYPHDRNNYDEICKRYSQIKDKLKKG